MLRAITFAFIFLISVSIRAQLFQNVTNQNALSHSYTGVFGAGSSFYDFNKDGWPDLSFCDKDEDPSFYMNIQGQMSPIDPFISNSGDMKSLSWVDYDNDGDADLFITRYLGNFQLYNNDSEFNFTDVSFDSGLQATEVETYGHSWGDYDRDGFLDLYICNYNVDGNVENILYHNNGNGTFSDLTEFTGLGDGYRYSFQSVWFDLNQDLWPDLYVINDKITQNSLYINNTDGTFTEASFGSGSNIVIDAMSNSIADYDNDGDEDIYVTNGPGGNVLLKNDGDLTFTNYTSTAGVAVYDMCWGALFSDFDNDGWQELLVCAGNLGNQLTPNYYYENNGDGTFSFEGTTMALFEINSYSPSEGDFDNDGDNDIAILNSAPSNSHLWENIQDSQNYLKLDLQGVISNRDAIGVMIECYINGEKQIRYTYCGENFLGQNSQYEILGLGESEMIDSLTLKWPSGHVDQFYDIVANQFIPIVEGASLTATISFDGELSFCDNDSIILDAGQGNNYLWSDGSVERYLTVYSSGEFSFQTTSDLGLIIYSDTVSVEVWDNPELFIEEIQPACFGDLGSVIFDVTGGTAPYYYQGDQFDGLLMLTDLPEGESSVTIEDSNFCLASNTFQIILATEIQIELEATPETEFTGGQIDAEIIGGHPPYTFLWSNGEESEDLEDIPPGEYGLWILDSNGCMQFAETNVDAFVGIINRSLPEYLIYPNPTSSGITVQGAGLNEFRVYNSQGRLMMLKDHFIHTDNNYIDFSNWNEGVYWLTMSSGTHRISKKIILQ